ncbi:MAG: glycosyltransferase [Alphaproteobacteria bacterium]|nr:glycosyltransferase [Alphaproteobacteria bacterium]
MTALGALALLTWSFLLLGRGGFWRARERLDFVGGNGRGNWPVVVAIVPARDEAALVGRSIGSLFSQDYPGRFSVVLADDHGTDGTGAVALHAAGTNASRLQVISVPARPPGWVGKVWAMAQGLKAAEAGSPEFVWFTDADIAHAPGMLRALVAKAEAERRDLVSVMVMLSCRGGIERLLIPAFVYFFQQLYPFAWVADPARATAAAAGGSMLVRRQELLAAGGLDSIRGALIDDCALAGVLKARGCRLWLGLSQDSASLRPYGGVAPVWGMVARTAYTQLRSSPLLLVLTLFGLALVYLAAPALVVFYPLHGDVVATGLGLAAWALLALSFVPMLGYYRQPLWLAVALPLAGVLYALMTADSARQHWLGRGGAWKGRVVRAGGDRE